MKKERNISISLTKDHEGKILELFEHYLSYLIKKDDKTIYPYFADFGILYYSDNHSGIHWYELLANVLIKEIFKSKQYWQNRYVVQCIELYASTCEHPVDWIYEKHLKLINNISLFRTSEEQMDELIKDAKKLKQQEKDKSKDKEKDKGKKDKKELKNSKSSNDEFFG